MYSGKSVPAPDRVRFYPLNTEGFWDVAKNFRILLDANQRVLNPAFVPAYRVLQLYLQCYARSYLLSCYHDIYQQFSVHKARFTPSKVSCVLEQPIPKLLLDCLRELLRPQVSPEGLLLVPSPDSFLNDVKYDPNFIVRNSVRLGRPDQNLLQFGIMWFPCLAHVFRAAWMTGTEDGAYSLDVVEGVKREGLEPAKMSALIRVIRSGPKDKAKEDGKVEVPSASASSAPSAEPEESEDKKIAFDFRFGFHISKEAPVPELKKLEKGEDWSRVIYVDKHGATPSEYTDGILPEPIEVEVTANYWMHDFDGQADAMRDFAMRILRPIVLDFRDDVTRGRVQQAIEPTPASIAFFGVDLYRGSVPYTVWQFQLMMDMMGGHPLIYDRSFYVNRWASDLRSELRKWHFPKIGEAPASAEPRIAPVSKGPKQRQRRGKRGAGKPAPAAAAAAPAPLAPK